MTTILEAECRNCRATFNPTPDDYTSDSTAAHHECGGEGDITGTWTTTPGEK